MISNKYNEIKLTNVFTILSVFFWLSLLHGQFDGGCYMNPSDIDSLKKFLTMDFPIKNAFNIAEWSVLLFSFYLIFKYQDSYILDTFYWRIFVSSIFVFIFVLINPNNSIYGIDYLMDAEIHFMYFFIFLFIALCFLKGNFFSKVIIQHLENGKLIFIIICIFSLIKLIIGRGIEFYGGFKSTIVEGGTLYFLGIYHVIYFSLYLINREKKDLFTAIIFFITLILSYRRSALAMSLISDFMIFTIWIVKTGTFLRQIKKLLLPILGIILIIFLLSKYNSDLNLSDLYQRQTAILIQLGGNTQIENNLFTDSGHLKQSQITTSSFLTGIFERFWGAGLKNFACYVPGQSQGGIHNSIVYVWAKYGLYMSLYLIYLFIIFITLFFRILNQKVPKIHQRHILFNLTIVILLINFFISGFFTGFTMFTGGVQTQVMFILLLSLLKINYRDNWPLGKEEINRNFA